MKKPMELALDFYHPNRAGLILFVAQQQKGETDQANWGKKDQSSLVLLAKRLLLINKSKPDDYLKMVISRTYLPFLKRFQEFNLYFNQ